jgi:hypothetical protein
MSLRVAVMDSKPKEGFVNAEAVNSNKMSDANRTPIYLPAMSRRRALLSVSLE